MGGCPFSVMDSLIHNFRTFALLFQPFILAKVLPKDTIFRINYQTKLDKAVGWDFLS